MLLKIFKLLFILSISLQVNIALADVSGKYVALNELTVFIYSDTKPVITTKLNAGTQVFVVGVSEENKQWFKISLQENQYGFVHKDSLKKVSAKKSKTPNEFDSFFGGDKPQESAVSAGTQPIKKNNYDDFFSKSVVDGQVAELEQAYQAKQDAKQEEAYQREVKVKEEVKENEKQIARCNNRYDNTLKKLTKLGELVNEHHCDDYQRSKTLFDQLDAIGNHATESTTGYVEDCVEELGRLNDEMAKDIEKYINHRECKNNNNFSDFSQVLNEIKKSNVNTLNKAHHAIRDAWDNSKKYERREAEIAKKQSQKRLNDLRKTANMYKKQNQQIMRDTDAAFKKSNAIRQKQENLAKQDNARKQQEYQNKQNALKERERIAAKNQKEYREKLQRQQDTIKKRDRTVTQENNQYVNAQTSPNLGSTNSSSQANNKTEQKSSSKNEIEALAYCWQTKSKKGWYCDGYVTESIISSKTLEEELSLNKCENYRKKVTFNGGWIFFCNKMLNLDVDTGKMTWNRDISQWITIPQSILNQRL